MVAVVATAADPVKKTVVEKPHKLKGLILPEPKEESLGYRLFDAGKFTISPFAAVRLGNDSKTVSGKCNTTSQQVGNDENWAGGLALTYYPLGNVAVEVSALTYHATGHSVIDTIDEAGVNFKWYVPIRATGWAPYGIVGYTGDTANHDHLGNIGAGLAWNLRRVEVFLDGQYRNNFENNDRSNQFLARCGVGLTW